MKISGKVTEYCALSQYMNVSCSEVKSGDEERTDIQYLLTVELTERATKF